MIAACLFPDGEGARLLKSKAAYPDNVIIIGLDVTKDQSVKAAAVQVSQIVSRLRKLLFGVVNNAGVGPSNYLEWANVSDDYIKVYDVNVFGIVRVCKEFLPLIRKSKGRIVNIASIAGREGLAQQGSYCSSKAAVIAVSKTLKREVRRFGVKVICVEPYFYATNLNCFQVLSKSLVRGWESLTPDVRDAYGLPYFNALLRFYHKFSGSMYLRDYSPVAEMITTALTVSYPEECYVSAPFVIGSFVWSALTLIPLDLHEFFYRIMEASIPYSYLVSDVSLEKLQQEKEMTKL